MNDPKYSKNTKINLLLKVTPWVTEDRVAAYLKTNKFHFEELFEEVLNIGYLNDNQYLGIIFMTLIIGANWVNKLPSMLANYKDKQQLVYTLKPALIQSGMPQRSASWVVKNLKAVRKETLELIAYLDDQN